MFRVALCLPTAFSDTKLYPTYSMEHIKQTNDYPLFGTINAEYNHDKKG